jgi:hypothetical protein
MRIKSHKENIIFSDNMCRKIHPEFKDHWYITGHHKSTDPCWIDFGYKSIVVTNSSRRGNAEMNFFDRFNLIDTYHEMEDALYGGTEDDPFLS